MHPPFIFPHHPVHDDFDQASRRAPRRTRPSVLRLRPTRLGWPPVLPVEAHPAPEPAGPRPVRLAVVPPPQETWRDIIGRFLIRTGQRMILQNRPG